MRIAEQNDTAYTLIFSVSKADAGGGVMGQSPTNERLVAGLLLVV